MLISLSFSFLRLVLKKENKVTKSLKSEWKKSKKPKMKPWTRMENLRLKLLIYIYGLVMCLLM